jgi:hypothetical protein
MALPHALTTLLQTHPLPERWWLTDALLDTAHIADLELQIAGLVATRDDGIQAWGSAAERGEVPAARAFFELYERLSILDALEDDATVRRPLDARGAPLQSWRPWSPPKVPAGAPYAYARSNGVACGRSWSRACEAAEAELVERDRVLRAWYGLTRPEAITLPDDLALRALGETYTFVAHAFPPDVRGPRSPLEVTSLCGFPRTPAAPLVLGFGAAATRTAASERALRECLQRLAFLWGESIPTSEPEFATTADYHQEFFLWPASHEPLARFLAGGHVREAARLVSPTACGAGLGFVDVQPRRPSGLAVARAIGDDALPLVFGRGHPSAVGELPESLRVHPIA